MKIECSSDPQNRKGDGVNSSRGIHQFAPEDRLQNKRQLFNFIEWIDQHQAPRSGC
jgi:hypothetical protein